MPRDNPYWHRGPIRDADYFYGRSVEVTTALSMLRHLQSISLVGPRRVGKTSMLHYISHPSVLEAHRINPDRYIFVFIDCQGLGDLGRADFYQLMLKETRESIAGADLEVGLAGLPERGSITYMEFQDTLETITQSGLKLTFLFDEFEGMSHNENLDAGFFGGLRGIASNLDVAYVTASRRSLFDLTYAEGVLSSPFFNLFTTINVGLFEASDAHTLIEEPSRAAGVAFSEETVDSILTLADHHPLYLQIACFHAFDLQPQKGDLGLGLGLGSTDHRLLRQRVEPELIGHLKYAWSQLTEQERQALSSLETAQDDPRLRRVMESLKNQCVICPREDRYVLLCGPWADFVQSQAPEGPGNEPVEPEWERGDAPAVAPLPSAPPDVCDVSVQLSPRKNIVVEIEGAISYLEEARGLWQVSDEDITRFNRDVGQLFDSAEWKYNAKRIGKDLYRELVDTKSEVSSALNVSFGRVRRNQDLRISFKVPRRHLQLPLELLHDDDWLALKHPLSKYITGLQIKRRPLSASLWHGQELRVLLVASNVSGRITVSGQQYWLGEIPGADAELEEVRALFDRLAGDGQIRFRLEILGTDKATYARVRDELQSGQHHLFHYSGHGFFDRRWPENSSLFFWEAGRGSAIRAMTASELKLLIQDSDLHFAYFSCCEGATQAGVAGLLDNDFLGIVDASVEAGLPAVLGMRWPVDDGSARVLAREFYDALFREGALDTALLKARQAIASRDRKDITWVSPVLVVQG